MLSIVLGLTLLPAADASHWQRVRHLPQQAFTGEIIVQLSRDSEFSVDARGVVSPSSRRLIDIDALIAGSGGGTLMNRAGVRHGRKFDDAPATLRDERRALEQACHCTLPDLAGMLSLSLPPSSRADFALVLDRLNALPGVARAFPKLKARASSTPSLTAFQGYASAAPNGLDALYAHTIAGADGTGVRVGSVEGAWTLTHEDLPTCKDVGTAQDTDSESIGHGTAVLGEVFGKANTFGVTGIAPMASCQVSSWNMGNGTQDSATALKRHMDSMQAGDVIFVSGQVAGPNATMTTPDDQTGFVPIEWDPADYDMIQMAVNKGIIVAIAAGNGGDNLDGPAFQGWFSPSNSTGSIMVGAGAVPNGDLEANIPRGRLSFSTYGSRVDVQGWGEDVTTTGFGDAYPGNSSNPSRAYTYVFNGTSSATPMVAGVVAAVQSYAKAKGRAPLSAKQMRDLLVSTGSAQTGDTSTHIGPLPNLRAALATFDACGDGKIEPPEVCDDGNTKDGDGCSSNCMSKEVCGNGIVDHATGEVCDDSNTTSGDGCSADCKSNETCGNHIVDKGEVCDDGNTVSGDGCEADCKSTAACGNHIVDPGEVCDDGNTQGGDGCAADCKSNETCGNHVVDPLAGEQCDDGNTMSGDGCSAMCQSEHRTAGATGSSGGSGGVNAGPETAGAPTPTPVATSTCNGAPPSTLSLPALALFWALWRRRRLGRARLLVR